MDAFLPRGLILFLDLAILLAATGICRYGRHQSFWTLILPLAIVTAFSFLVAADVDNFTRQNVLGQFGDFPVRSVIWRSILGTGLVLRLIRGASMAPGKHL